MRWRTDFRRMRLAVASAEAMAEVKKYFSSKMPRGVAMYLFEVTRRHGRIRASRWRRRRSCRFSGLQVLDAVREEAVLLAHDLLGDLQDGAGALVEALHQPVGGLQAFEQIALVLRRSRVVLRDRGEVGAVDQHARQRVGVELDDPAAVGAPRARGRRAPPAASGRSRT